MTRNNFTTTQEREMRKRSGDICEAGKGETHKMYGMADGDKCTRAAQQFDHVVADALKRTRIQSIDEGLHVCIVHHKIKTKTHDMPKISKAKRIEDRSAGMKKKGKQFQSQGFRPAKSNTKFIDRGPW